MNSDITDFIADLVIEADAELATRAEYQAEALRETACTNPAAFGRWVDANAVNLLFSAFALEDMDFAVRFPKLKHITGPERQKFIADLEGHFETCKHCSLKRGYDLELDARIEKACLQNSAALLRLLREEEAEPSDEGDHPMMKFEPAI